MRGQERCIRILDTCRIVEVRKTRHRNTAEERTDVMFGSERAVGVTEGTDERLHEWRFRVGSTARGDITRNGKCTAETSHENEPPRLAKRQHRRAVTSHGETGNCLAHCIYLVILLHI